MLFQQTVLSSAVDGWLMMIVQQEEKYDSLSKQIKTRKAPVSDELEERAPHCWLFNYDVKHV